MPKGRLPVSQSVSYFTVPPRAHPSTGSQSAGCSVLGTKKIIIAESGSITVATRRLRRTGGFCFVGSKFIASMQVGSKWGDGSGTILHLRRSFRTHVVA